ncbi:MAG: hypothetical protein AMK69_13060 [Nitrospira bacterium SG8_3]|nr:MAG: hypothetical protein AMK69_13060 [Nitrospira bacterium SG8_3]
MKDTISFSNEQEEPQDKSHSVSDEQEGRGGASVEMLENQIANRAYEISQRRGGHHEQSLASWLEAAREILSEDFESSH